MAEIVEINLVCDEIINHKILLSFINNKMPINCRYNKIEVMDNWEYENFYELDSEENLLQLVDKKIVCITRKEKDGYVGLNIEKVENVFCYTLWFNQEKYEFSNEYSKLIERFVLFAKQEIDNKFNICAIGKEVFFEYHSNKNKLFDASHNIDVWINLDIDITDSILKKYERCDYDNCIILKNRNINKLFD